MAKILCIDDETAALSVRKRVLETAGHQVLTARSGEEGIQLFRSQPLDLVLLDYWMPGMNGIDATRAIVQELPGTAVVVLTMHDSKTLVRLALRAGARRCLLKPEVTQHLMEAVESLITPQDVPVSTSSSESGGTKEGHSRVSKKNPRR